MAESMPQRGQIHCTHRTAYAVSDPHVPFSPYERGLIPRPSPTSSALFTDVGSGGFIGRVCGFSRGVVGSQGPRRWGVFPRVRFVLSGFSLPGGA